MATWVDVLVTAFVLQLLALPGEKGQLVIAGLATKYNPYAVVAGAATAFGGWTLLEIYLGQALQGALPELYLDVITAGLFVAFAIWILYSRIDDLTADASTSEPATNGDSDSVANGGQRTLEHASDAISSSTTGYLSSFSAMAFAEFGDKTQLVTISLAVQYGAHPAIWVGEMLAIVPVSLATALVFDRVAHYFNLVWVHRAAAAMFLLFAADIVAEYAFGVSVLPL
ncbi:TMEM165/GDT1 family protein [Natribaculum luteum]|uniref:TMEM165/GDT1 family protein n=1 Tax=Natribaculum luteum TaxID=1586232 RepID=A0ABD5NV97_9EURY|nr:TMEM165/GDT1 family protein [Natribaculum luteum]